MQNTTKVNVTQIREHMPIVCSEGGQFGAVDHVEGDFVKVAKNNSSNDGQHHWFPISWVTQIDSQVHVDRSGTQAMKDWLSTDPAQQ